MARDRRFRSITLAELELVEARDDGTIVILGESGSGDAVAVTVRPEVLQELIEGLQAPQAPRTQ